MEVGVVEHERSGLLPFVESRKQRSNLAEVDPKAFASVLSRRLEKVKESRGKIENLISRFHLQESRLPEAVPMHAGHLSAGCASNTCGLQMGVTKVLSVPSKDGHAGDCAGRLPEEEATDAQVILEEHFSRIWTEDSDIKSAGICGQGDSWRAGDAGRLSGARDWRPVFKEASRKCRLVREPRQMASFEANSISSLDSGVVTCGGRTSSESESGASRRLKRTPHLKHTATSTQLRALDTHPVTRISNPSQSIASDPRTHYKFLRPVQGQRIPHLDRPQDINRTSVSCSLYQDNNCDCSVVISSGIRSNLQRQFDIGHSFQQSQRTFLSNRPSQQINVPLANCLVKKEAIIGGEEETSKRLCSTSSSGIVVGYYLCDDPVPYRTVWTGPLSHVKGDGMTGSTVSITLSQFKQLVAKRGTYKYFFKTVSDEFGSGAVNQEVVEDHELLPLWDGNIIARVVRVD